MGISNAIMHIIYHKQANIKYFSSNSLPPPLFDFLDPSAVFHSFCPGRRYFNHSFWDTQSIPSMCDILGHQALSEVESLNITWEWNWMHTRRGILGIAPFRGRTRFLFGNIEKYLENCSAKRKRVQRAMENCCTLTECNLRLEFFCLGLKTEWWRGKTTVPFRKSVYISYKF